MGTNYYLEVQDKTQFKQDCPCCGKSDYIPPNAGRIHIGKASYGWCFALHVDAPDIGVLVIQRPTGLVPKDLEGWKEAWSQPGVRIVNEYGTYLTPEEMLKIITERTHPNPGDVAHLTEFDYAQNDAVPGPNGLARSKIDFVHCIGHGEGTWDYCVGEFS